MSLQTPENIRNFQKKLYLKAKAEKAQGIDARYPVVSASCREL